MSTEDHDYKRMNMWCDIFMETDYPFWSKNKRKRAKLAYAKERGLMPYQIEFSSIAELQCYAEVKLDLGSEEEEKEIEMYNENTEQTQRKYLNSRLYNVRTDKVTAAQLAFGLRSEYPQTQKQLLEWVQAGRYVYNAKTDELDWRDPTVVSDRAGYDAWTEKLDAACQTVKDTLAISPPEDGLKALREFEAATIQ